MSVRQARSCSGNPLNTRLNLQVIDRCVATNSWQGDCSRRTMSQTQADVVRQTLKSLLEKQPHLARTPEGRSKLAGVVAHVLEQTCQVQHWFGPQNKGAEQDLLLVLNSAQPEDA